MDKKMLDMTDMLRNSVYGQIRHSAHNHESDCDDPLTMAFVNIQPLESVYNTPEALCNGTLFPNLNKPFMGGTVR